MAEHSEMTATAGQQRSDTARRTHENARSDVSQQPLQDGLAPLLESITASVASNRGARSGGEDPPPGSGKITPLQRQQAQVLGDTRLDHPMYTQRRADLFLHLQQAHGNIHARQVAGLLREHQHQQTTPVQRRSSAPNFPSMYDRYTKQITPLQRSDAKPSQVSPVDVAGEIQQSRGKGEALDPAARGKLEGAMGVGLGSVRIHTDSQADTLSRSVAAEAFTTGQDIYFRSGRYEPHSDRGLHLLAHEVTHTVQQSTGAVSGTQHSSGISVSDPADSFEQEAEQNATQTMSRIHSAPVTAAGASPGVPMVTNKVWREASPDEERVDRLATPGASRLQRMPAGDEMDHRQATPGIAVLQRSPAPNEEEDHRRDTHTAGMSPRSLQVNDAKGIAGEEENQESDNRTASSSDQAEGQSPSPLSQNEPGVAGSTQGNDHTSAEGEPGPPPQIPNTLPEASQTESNLGKHASASHNESEHEPSVLDHPQTQSLAQPGAGEPTAAGPAGGHAQGSPLVQATSNESPVATPAGKESHHEPTPSTIGLSPTAVPDGGEVHQTPAHPSTGESSAESLGNELHGQTTAHSSAGDHPQVTASAVHSTGSAEGETLEQAGAHSPQTELQVAGSAKDETHEHALAHPTTGEAPINGTAGQTQEQAQAGHAISSETATTPESGELEQNTAPVPASGSKTQSLVTPAAGQQAPGKPGGHQVQPEEELPKVPVAGTPVQNSLALQRISLNPADLAGQAMAWARGLLDQIRGDSTAKGTEIQGHASTMAGDLQGQSTGQASELQGESTTQGTALESESTAQGTVLGQESTARSTELQGEATSTGGQLSGESATRSTELGQEAGTSAQHLEGSFTQLNTGANSQVMTMQGEVGTGEQDLTSQAETVSGGQHDRWTTFQTHTTGKLSALTAQTQSLQERKKALLAEQMGAGGEGSADRQSRLVALQDEAKTVEQSGAGLSEVEGQGESMSSQSTSLWSTLSEKGHGLMAKATAAATSAWHTVENTWSALKGKASEMLTSLSTKVSGAWNGLKEKVGQAWNGLKNKATQAWSGLKEKATQAWSGLKEKVGQAWNGLKDKASTLWTALKEKAGTVATTLGSMASAAVSAISGMASRIMQWFSSMVGSVLSGLRSAASAALASLKAKASAAWNGLKNLGTRAWNGLKNLGTRAWNGLKNLGTRAWNGLKDLGTRAWNGLKNLGTRAWNGLKAGWNRLKQMAESAWNKIKQAWQTLKQKAIQLWDWIKRKAKAALAWLKKAWAWLKEQILKAWNWLKKAWAWLKAKAKELRGVSVKVQPSIRASSTPPEMTANRIPPGVDVPATITVSGWDSTMPPITVSVEGSGGSNGTVTINGTATVNVPEGSTTVQLKGGTQTAPGSAGKLKLSAKQGAAVLGTSDGFSVAAIPENYSDVFVSPLTGTKRGFVVQDGWSSDSGTFADLDQTEISERVEYTKFTGTFIGSPPAQNSGYLPGNSLTTDTHSVGTASLTSPGEKHANQTCMFKDKRTGATDIPMTKSGFKLVRTVVLKGGGGGGLQITTTKDGAACTARGIHSEAGSAAISLTQDV